MHYLLLKDKELRQVYITKGVNPMPHWKEKGMGCIGSPDIVQFNEIVQCPDDMIKVFEACRDGLIKDDNMKEELERRGLNFESIDGIQANTIFTMGTDLIIKCQKIIGKLLKDDGPLNVIDAIDMGGKILVFIRMSLDDKPLLIHLVDDKIKDINGIREGSTSVLDEIFAAKEEDDKDES
jgi:hypothetical protein